MQAPGVDPKPQRGWRYAQIHLALIAALACGCNLDNQGDRPPEDLLYFTNALALSASDPAADVPPRYLFAANSNYDLRYSAGSVFAIDLERVQELVDQHGGEPNYVIPSSEVVVDEAFIGSYSTALGLAPDGDTLFVATRTDTSLAFMHVDDSADGDGVLTCASEDEGRECSLRATPIVDPTTNEPLVWPADPTSILARPLTDFTGPADKEGDPCTTDEECSDATFCNEDGVCEAKETRTAVLVSHRDGLVSLFTTASDGEGFDFVDIIAGFGNSLTGLDFEPTSRLAYGSNAGAAFARVGVAVTEGSPPVLYGADAVPLSASSNVIVGRDVEFLPAMGGGLAGTQNNMLVVGQNPNALFLVALDDQPRNGDPTKSLRVVRSTVVGFGAYRVATGELNGKPIAIVSCLDSREIYIIDLDTMLPISVVPHLSGPFDIQYDDVRQLLYVADYHSSVIRVLDLSPLADFNGKVPALLVATIGEPRVIQELR